MGTTVHIGHVRKQTCKGSDNSLIPLGALTATTNSPSIATVAIDPATNEVSITGVSAGSALITYNAAGYVSYSGVAAVSPLPNIVVTDGVEV